MTVEQVNPVASSLIRKYDWKTDQLGYGVRLTVNDGDKHVSVYITSVDEIVPKINRAIELVDNHEYDEDEA